MHIKPNALWTGLAAVGLVAAGLATAAAQPPGGSPPQRQGIHARGGGPGRGPGPMLGHLDLTDAQREQVRAILEERRNDADAPMRKRAELERELRAAIFADAPDTAKIEHLKTAIAEAEAAALASRIEVELKIAQILTPDQRAKARDARAARGRGPGLGR